MYKFESLPPLGKEYWWFLFFGRNGKRPVQLMLLIFRKHGKKMLFNDKEMVLREVEKNKLRAVTSGWIYDGKKLCNLGDTNAIVEIPGKKIVSEISGQKMTLGGGFPNYELTVGNLINLKITKGDCLEDNAASGVFLPPFGMSWIDIFSSVEGIVLGKKFKGTGHLQKVFGVTIFGPFHWGRLVFQNGSSTSFFCLKTGRNSKTYFRRSLIFHDIENKRIIRFDNPKLEILKMGNNWIVEGSDIDKTLKMVLETYATKRYVMKGGGSQVYIEYAVIPKEFKLRTKDKIITLDDTGKGVGTLEDAYW
ncbi:MAG: hypothetical protein J7J38_03520 [Candidatus Aenigmarchaeota archaeon]|nr:hypothetical protein [Candidatus Aenigmarchaeota archaeon]